MNGCVSSITKYMQTLAIVDQLHADGKAATPTAVARIVGCEVSTIRKRFQRMADQGMAICIYGRTGSGYGICDVMRWEGEGPAPREKRKPKMAPVMEIDSQPEKPKWIARMELAAKVEQEREERRKALLAAEHKPKKRSKEFWDAATVRALSGGTISGGLDL